MVAMLDKDVFKVNCIGAERILVGRSLKKSVSQMQNSILNTIVDVWFYFFFYEIVLFFFKYPRMRRQMEE